MRKVRNYKKYNNYLEHQKEKTLDPVRRKKWLNEEWELKINGFKKSFSNYEEYIINSKALCIGARTGQEVVALNEMGANAIGVDICPCPPHVVEGDMHDLPFESDTFDFVFSNVLDHSLYPEKKINEIERVLKKGGKAVLHLQVNIPSDIYTETEIENVYFDILPLFQKSLCLKLNRINNPVFATMNIEIIMEKINTDLDISIESLIKNFDCNSFVRIYNTEEDNSYFLNFLKENNIDKNLWSCKLPDNSSDFLSTEIHNSGASVDMFYIDANRQKGDIIRDIYYLKKCQSENPIWVFENLTPDSDCHWDILSILNMSDKFKIYLNTKRNYELVIIKKFV